MENLLDPRDDVMYDDDKKRIIRNSAICNKCKEEVVSKYRHDFRSCSCGDLSVDGGTAYLRRVFGAYGFTDTSVMDVKET